jgi:hypothetical protein
MRRSLRPTLSDASPSPAGRTQRLAAPAVVRAGDPFAVDDADARVGAVELLGDDDDPRRPRKTPLKLRAFSIPRTAGTRRSRGRPACSQSLHALDVADRGLVLLHFEELRSASVRESESSVETPRECPTRGRGDTPKVISPRSRSASRPGRVTRGVGLLGQVLLDAQPLGEVSRPSRCPAGRTRRCRRRGSGTIRRRSFADALPPADVEQVELVGVGVLAQVARLPGICGRSSCCSWAGV